MIITHLQLLSNDLEATHEFYGVNLGFDLLLKTSQQITYKTGKTNLTFQWSEMPRPRYHFTFDIPVNQLHNAVNWLQKKISTITPPDQDDPIVTFDNWNAQSVYFWDNNENLLEFIIRKDNNSSDSQPFSSNSILNISEIGIPAEKPSAMAEYLQNKFNLPIYHKGPNRLDFTVLGDEEGLLLIPVTERIWFPSKDFKAIKTWLKLSFIHNGFTHVYEPFSPEQCSPGLITMP